MLNNKIKNILLIKDMSPSRFADEIGVQRSSISHILSGRNKPSLEIIQKIVKRFPELGRDWFIDDDDEQADDDELLADNLNTKPVNTETGKAKLPESKSVQENLSSSDESFQTGAKRKVEKILIFYSDKTFTEYKPE